MNNVKLISKKDVQEVLDMEKSIQLVEKVYEAHGRDQVLMPAKITLDTGESNDWPPYGGSYNAMPAYIGGDVDISGIKWVWGFNDNYKKGIPYIGGVIILNEARTGEILAIMDGSFITDIRTGASAGVACKYLARKDASVVGIIGAGVQGRMNARAVAQVLDLKEIRVADIRPEAARACAEELTAELGLPVRAAASNQEACEGADVIITVTIADEPLVKKEWLKKGATVLSLGSFQELDEEIPLTCDKLVVDSWAQNAHRGELLKLVHEGRITENNIHAEMPDIVVGRKTGRENDEEIICGCIIGMGSTDIGTAGQLYKEVFAGAELPAFAFRTYEK
ncbi:ornithine cyclodeaminase family protein [Bacilliculturomica massiliensis]|uniref:ornithine cyclodeaminase family protein n=1 Tax=Bacilliculturomica massiliensis TaxID=1917867 RepID=UPI0013EF4B3B|nr:ornithine cyclodeaminase family protein [Bacilliculturomica massiliensis]